MNVTIIDKKTIQVIGLSQTGPAGRSGDIIECVAGESISALSPVYLLDGKVYSFKNNTNNVDVFLGISTIAATENNKITVKRYGVLSDNSFSNLQGRIFLGYQGELTNNIPLKGLYFLIGRITGNDLILNFNDYIIIGE